MRVALQKLPGVEAVDVSLEKAVVDLRLLPGNTLTLTRVRGVIKSGGFNSREADVTVLGHLIDRAGSPALEVTGTNLVMPIVAEENRQDIHKQVLDRLRAAPGSSVELTGRVEATPEKNERIAVRSLR